MESVQRPHLPVILLSMVTTCHDCLGFRKVWTIYFEQACISSLFYPRNPPVVLSVVALRPSSRVRYDGSLLLPPANMAEPNSSLTRLFTFRFPLLHPRTPPEGGNVPSFATEGLDQAELPGIDESFPIDPAVLHAHLLDLVLRLQALLQDSCGWMEQGDIEFVGEHPADAGGVADVRVGKMGNREVAIKSYRSHSSSDHLPIYAVSGTYLRYAPITESLSAEVLQRSTGV